LLERHDCGVTYAPGDAGRLVELLVELRADPERLRAMSRNAAELFERRFSADKVYGEMATYLVELGARLAPAG
jgi:hypothetical protein